MRKILIDDWKRAWTYLSVILASALVALDIAYAYLPEIRDYFPEGWVRYVAVAVIIGRIIKQGQKSD